MLPLRPDMASLAVGSNNFPTRVYENPPDLVDWLASEMLTHGVKPEIEAFDLSPHLPGPRDAGGRAAEGPALRAVRDGREERDAGRPGALFDFYMATTKRLSAPDARVVRRRDRAGADRRSTSWCDGGRGAHPDRARGQRPARPATAGAVERRAGAAGGGALRPGTAAGRHVGAGAGAVGAPAGLRSTGPPRASPCQGMRTSAPMVRRASRSRWASAARSSG